MYADLADADAMRHKAVSERWIFMGAAYHIRPVELTAVVPRMPITISERYGTSPKPEVRNETTGQRLRREDNRERNESFGISVKWNKVPSKESSRLIAFPNKFKDKPAQNMPSKS